MPMVVMAVMVAMEINPGSDVLLGQGAGRCLA